MKKSVLAVCFITAAAVFIAIGLFLGRNMHGGVLTAKPASAEPVSQKTQPQSNRSDGDKARININTASAPELEKLSGIGPKLAEEIVRYREAVGGFSVKEQLMEVDGIGEKTYEAIEPFIIID